jgi:uncharacterized membrane protein YeiH
MISAGFDMLDLLEFAGVLAFALSAAFAAAGRKLDVAVMCVAAVASGLVGGTLRDLLTGAPVFWLERPLYLAAPLVVAGAVWALGDRPWAERAVTWCDAVGLAAVAGAGVGRAATAGVEPLGAAAVGVLAAAAASLVRDGFTRRAPMALGRDLYLGAALLGAVVAVALRLLQVDIGLAALGGAALALFLRSGAIRSGWALPSPPERD